ncbi:MAG: hypothetical protein CK540_01760 [Thermoleophilia bacterium]|nr:MAG: hypothetical protein CK540_01760 [Thermoleophilia bacterium]
MMRSLLIALLALLVVGVPAQAASLSSTGSFLASSLDANGCARESGAGASVNLTSWAALGLVASGRSASSAASCIERHSKALTSTTDIELAVLALAAAGRNPDNANGRNLVKAIQGSLKNGRIGSLVASNQFGILALKAAGAPIPASAKRTLLGDQNRDGSWPVASGGDGDSNLTASGIMAAVAAGIAPNSTVIVRAVASLKRFRSRGGYALTVGSPPDAQSTAWILQGLAAAGKSDPAAEAYLASLQRSNGAVAYQRGLVITPVWVTAQAALGLARRPFPLRP